MTCDDVNSSSTARDHVRGLCLKHAVELALSIPEDRREYGWHGRAGGRAAPIQYLETVAAILSKARCEECPSFTRASMWNSPEDTKPLYRDRLGPECQREATAALDAKYTRGLPMILTGVHDPKEDFDAAAITLRANVVMRNAWRTEFNAWPRCANCPVPAQPVKALQDSSVERAVIAALAAHGVPMTIGDLIALKIKGFSRNTSSRTMEHLVESGAVVLTSRGPAKFYELP